MFRWEKENEIMKLYFTLFGQPYELVATLEKFDTEDWKYEIFLDKEIDFLPIEFFNSQQEAKKEWKNVYAIILRRMQNIIRKLLKK